MRRLAIIGALLLAAACDRGRPDAFDGEVAIRVTGAPAEIEIGRSFPLTVVRAWDRELEPDPWNDAALKPLVVRLDEIVRREDDRHVEETLRFRAYAFEPGPVTVAPLAFAAAPKAGGPPRRAAAEGFTTRVKPTLDAKTAGPPEMPDLLREPGRWPLWTAIAIAALAGVMFFVRSSRKAARKRTEALADSAEARARARLDRLRATEPRSAEETDAWHVEASSAVRDYVAERHRIRAREQTTEEILAAPWGPERASLAAVFGTCDLVKFARHPSRKDDRARVIAEAEKFLEAQAGP